MTHVGVLSIVQETNTFAARASGLADFESQGLYRGRAAAEHAAGTNTEMAGAISELERRGIEAVPLLRAWAMSGGVLAAEALQALGLMLREEIEGAGTLDGLVVSLHGALAADGVDDADAWLLGMARGALGAGVPVAVCLDLHANVTEALVAGSDLLIGYHTYPHIDQAATGARAADLLAGKLAGKLAPRTMLAKRGMLLPAETTQTTNGPMAALRRLADRASSPPVLDVSIFPVQPWLDVPELGFAVTVTTDGEAEGQALADDLAELAWSMRAAFTVELVEPARAIELARSRTASGPLLVSESADSPTSGATADSPAVIEALLRHGRDLRAYATLVDAPAVARCHEAGVGAQVELEVGASLDRRYHEPVGLAGLVTYIGAGQVRLGGPAFTGMEVSMGSCAVVTQGSLSVLLTERPAPTFDPAAYRSVGLEPEMARLVAVRSANLFRAGYADISMDAVILDTAGASSPRLAALHFEHAPHPLYPVDQP